MVLPTLLPQIRMTEQKGERLMGNQRQMGNRRQAEDICSPWTLYSKYIPSLVHYLLLIDLNAL